MSIEVTFWVLAAALFHALWNAYVKKGQDPLIAVASIALVCGLFAALMLPFVGMPARIILPYLGVSVIVHTAYMISLSQAYRYGDFSLAYPIARGAAPGIVVVVSVFVLHETLEAKQLIAIAGILSGILIFALRRIGLVLADKRSMAYAALTAILIATYTLIDGKGVRLLENNAFNYVAWVVFLQAFPIYFYMLFTRGKAGLNALRLAPAQLIIGGFLAFAGYSIVLWAMTQAPIALVSAFRETSIIIAALIGMFWFKEPAGWRRLLAAAIIFASVVYLKMA